MISTQAMFSDSFTLMVGDLGHGKDGKPITMGEIMRQATNRFKAKIEASSNQKLKQTTFYIKSESEAELEKAKKYIISGLSPPLSIILNAPANTIPSIIGTKGASFFPFYTHSLTVS